MIAACRSAECAASWSSTVKGFPLPTHGRCWLLQRACQVPATPYVARPTTFARLARRNAWVSRSPLSVGRSNGFGSRPAAIDALGAGRPGMGTRPPRQEALRARGVVRSCVDEVVFLEEATDVPALRAGDPGGDGHVASRLVDQAGEVRMLEFSNCSLLGVAIAGRRV